MTKTAAHPQDGGLVHDQQSPKPDEIRRQLASILESPAFHGSKRCHQFLEYVCEKSLSGEVGALKERMIATEVFGRRPLSDLGEDTIVRVGAREVRKRLAQYYVTPDGVGAGIAIELPPGSYAPEFHYAHVRKVRVEEPREPRRGYRSGVILAVGFAALVAMGWLAVTRWTGGNPNTAVFQRFWDPVFRASEPLLLAVAHPIVYHPSTRAWKMSEARLPTEETLMQRPIRLQENQLDASDLVPVLNQYVGFGDMVVATQVSGMLARKSKDVRVRLASGIAFADLKRAPTLLIGAVTNRWTVELQPGWRFQFSRNADLKTVIVDTTDRREWSIPAKEDGSAPEDYMLICRIRNSVTGGLVLVAAGLKQFGTEAAGRLLTDPDQLGVILRKLPAGWEAKNLQVVLHVKVFGNTPAQPEVVAWHVW